MLWTHHGAPLNIRFWISADVLPQREFAWNTMMGQWGNAYSAWVKLSKLHIVLSLLYMAYVFVSITTHDRTLWFLKGAPDEKPAPEDSTADLEEDARKQEHLATLTRQVDRLSNQMAAAAKVRGAPGFPLASDSWRRSLLRASACSWTSLAT